jgi:hypothetical protein
MKQQSADRHVVPLGHIILIPSHSVFALSPLCWVLSGEATNANFIVFGLTWSGLDLTIYRSRGEHANHYKTDQVSLMLNVMVERKIINKRCADLTLYLSILICLVKLIFFFFFFFFKEVLKIKQLVKDNA